MLPRVELIEEVEFRKKIPKSLKHYKPYHPMAEELDGEARNPVVYQSIVNKHVVMQVERNRAKRLGYDVGKLRKASRD